MSTGTFDPRGLYVKCDRCGREYRCTSIDDCYETPEGGLSCTSCLVGGMPVVVFRDNGDGTLTEVVTDAGC